MNDNINKLKSKEAEILADIELLGHKLQIVRDELSGVVSKMKRIKNRKVRVSDHALIRYIEREYHLNLEDLKKEILTMPVIIGGSICKAGKFMINDRLCAIVKDNIVVTTYEV